MIPVCPAALRPGRASMASGEHSFHGAENDCVLTCSDGFEAAEITEAESAVSRQLLAGQHGESCFSGFLQVGFPAGSVAVAAIGSRLEAQALIS